MLDAFSPLKVVARGYSLTYDENRHLIGSINDVQKDDLLKIRVSDGSILARLKERRLSMSNEMPFKQSMHRLEEIVSLLEKNEIELETAIQYFEEGLKLVNQCDQQLKNFEEKVTVLMDTYQKDNANE